MHLLANVPERQCPQIDTSKGLHGVIISQAPLPTLVETDLTGYRGVGNRTKASHELVAFYKPKFVHTCICVDESEMHHRE